MSIFSEARHYMLCMEQTASNAEDHAEQAKIFNEDPAKYRKKAAECREIAKKIVEAECRKDEQAAKKLIERARRALIDVNF